MTDRRGLLHVILHSGHDLLAMDIKVTRSASSDPYCIVSLGSESHRTATVRDNLNPVWEDAFNFQVGTFLPQGVLLLLGEGDQAPILPTRMSIEVFDEDLVTADDPMGDCKLDLAPFLGTPNQWHYEEVPLKCPGTPTKTKGRLALSLCWEPAPPIPTYGFHLISTVGYSAACALQFIAANCRWQPAAPQGGGELSEPGVGASLALGTAVTLLAAVLQFLNAHIPHVARMDELVAGLSSSRALTAAVSGYRLGSAKPGAAASAPALLGEINVRSARHYEIAVTPAVSILRHVQLPLLVLGWLLPLAGFALTLVAMLLQMPALTPCAGELCAAGALVALAGGWAAMVVAERQASMKSVARWESYQLHRANTPSSLSDASAGGSECQRKRDVIWRHVPEGIRRSLGSG